MKLLLDENLSPKLARSLDNIYPGSVHIEDCGLASASDDDIWRYAKENGFTVVSRDSDFNDRSALYGSPPKVIRLRMGNCTTTEIENALRLFESTIGSFAGSSETTLILVRGTVKFSPQ